MTQDANFMKPAGSNPPPETTNIATTNTTSSGSWAGKVVLALAVAIALGASLYQSSQLSKELGAVKHQLTQSDHQITDMQGQMATSTADAKREVSETVAKLNEQLEKTRKESAVNSQRATYAVRQQTGKAVTELTAKNTELAEQLDKLKTDNTAKSTEVDQALTGIKGDVGDVKTEMASTKADLDTTKTDLRRAVGDMGVMSGLIATNSTELGELRKLGERNYIEFTLPKNGAPQKVGDVQMALKKTDIKRSRFTLDLLADDKRIEKRDKTVNEPVQFYTASMRLPYEVVINSVTKDSVKGYLAVPKVKLYAKAND
jgi:hypothetical protein